MRLPNAFHFTKWKSVTSIFIWFGYSFSQMYLHCWLILSGLRNNSPIFLLVLNSAICIFVKEIAILSKNLDMAKMV